RMGEPIDQPAWREPRHRGGDHRDALAGEEELEVAVSQGSPGVRDRTEERSLLCIRIVCGLIHNLRASLIAGYFSAKRLMMSPALNSVSRSCSSSWAMA